MFILAIFWLIFSYLLGSVPFGYLISRFCGKDILEIGWRKTSGSNVFKNVGKWQGVLTGILDVSKGYITVFGAQKIGLSSEVQIFAGVLAVTGHNWGIFLKFAGGRGIATFIGAFLALAPSVLGFSIIPLILSAIIWNAAIGTLLFLATAIFLSIYSPAFLPADQLEVTGVFTSLSLIPILIKRLSPVKELSSDKGKLIRNRLLFDNDKALFDLRIKKVFRGKNSNSSKALQAIKPLAVPLMLPPKIGWKLAKFGARMAAKPIEPVLEPVKEIISNGVKKLGLKPTKKVVTEIKVEDLKKMMIAATKKIVLHQEEINRINVFPVADKDTGYNLAATLLGIEGTIAQKEYPNLQELVKDIKEAAMMNARGNAGMIFTGYLIKVLDKIKSQKTVNAFRFALAMRKGVGAAYKSIYHPVEGTILDVIKSSGVRAFELARTRQEKNIIKVLEQAQKVSEKSLQETKEKLEVLKQNDVVDAGALGFVKILEAWTESLKGIVGSKVEPTEKPVAPVVLETEIGEERVLPRELTFSILKNKKIDIENLKQELSLWGESLDVLDSEDKIKFHIHTNFPEEIKERLVDFEILDWQLEDMIVGPQKVIEKRPLGLVVGETADLPKEFLGKHQIEAVPFKAHFPEKDPVWKSFVSEAVGEIYLDDLYKKMKKAKEMPTTSAAIFGDYLQSYKKTLEKFEKILVITLPARLSGAYSQARIARSIFEKPEKENIYVFDCSTVSVAEGLIVMKAQELISQGKTFQEIVNELREFCPKVKLFGCINNFKHVVHSGRLRLPKFLIPIIDFTQKIGIRLLFAVKDGKIRFIGVRFEKNIAEILAREIEKNSKGRKIRAAIAHAGNLKAAKELKEELEKGTSAEVMFISPVSPVIGVHAGPGTLIVAFYTTL